MTTTTHTFTDNKSVVDFFLKSMQQAQRDYAKNPNSTRWNTLIRKQFVYQQVFYAMFNVNADKARNQRLIDELNADVWCNYGDTVCKVIFDKSLGNVLSEVGVTVY
jgi:hypothetical protein